MANPQTMTPSPPSLPPLRVPAILRRYGLRPKKSLGQNFLVDDSALRKIVASAGITEADLVLEVGPGLGSLTRFLATQANRVIAVELDGKLMPPLREVLEPFHNITLLQGDILAQDIQALLTAADPQTPVETYVVVANIPYYITSALIRQLLEAAVKPDRIVLTVQREVAMRICADPPRMSLLALSVQVYGHPRVTAKIPAGSFYPPPTVDSAVIRVDLYPEPLIPPPYTETFFRLAKAGFSQKRKNLRNSLSGGLAVSKEQAENLLAAAEIDPRRRAETLTMDEWKALSYLFGGRD